MSASPRRSRAQPLRERPGDAVRQRQHGLPPEGAVGLLVIGVGVVAGNAEQHRRHAEGERDLARRRVLGLDEIHVLGRQRHRLPVEPAFEQQRPAGIGRALVAAPRVRASAARTGRRRAPRRPARHRPARRRAAPHCRAAPCSRRRPRCACRCATAAASSGDKPVVVVERMEQRQVQDRRHAAARLLEAHRARRPPCSRRPPASRPAPAPRACGRAAARTVRAPRRRGSPPRYRRCRPTSRWRVDRLQEARRRPGADWAAPGVAAADAVAHLAPS